MGFPIFIFYFVNGFFIDTEIFIRNFFYRSNKKSCGTCMISEETATILNETKAMGGRIICVGTTSCRTLESVATFNNGKIVPCDGYTEIFIYPGYKFKVVDAQITNFHLPKSTLVMLVSALASKEVILSAYEEAIKNNYRFFSFGDSMFIK